MSTRGALPDVQPIQPVLTKPFHREGFVYEEKYDGWRMIACKDGRHVCLVSRRGVDHTERFADISEAVRRLPARSVILDGEVCVFDESLISHMHLLMDPPADATVMSPVFVTFDCLYTRGRHVRGWPLKDRRKVLEDEVDGSPILPARRLPEDGLEAWRVVQEAGTRGCRQRRDGAVPVVEGQGPPRGRFLAGGLVQTEGGYVGLLLGRRGGRELRYVGTVEWGVTRALVPLTESVAARTASRFKDVIQCFAPLASRWCPD